MLSVSLTPKVSLFQTTIVGIAIASLATPFIIVAWIPVLFIFWNIQQKYRVTARELKRLTSIARSPIFAHFNETVTSLTVSIST